MKRSARGGAALLAGLILALGAPLSLAREVEIAIGDSRSGLRVISGLVIEKNAYQIKVGMLPGDDGQPTSIVTWSSRDVATIDGQPFAEYPDSARAPACPSVVLARLVDQAAIVERGMPPPREEVVLLGRVETGLLGVEVIASDGARQDIAWRVLRGVDGMSVETWLDAREHAPVTEMIARPWSRALAPTLAPAMIAIESIWQRLRLLAALSLLLILALAMAGGAAALHFVARSNVATLASPGRSAFAVTLGTLVWCVVFAIAARAISALEAPIVVVGWLASVCASAAVLEGRWRRRLAAAACGLGVAWVIALTLLICGLPPLAAWHAS